MKKKLLFIIVPVLLMIGVTVYMAVYLSRDSLKTFSRSGYILSSEKESGNSSGIKFYFNADTSYKNSYDDNVEFKDTNGDKIKVSDTSFVHYTDQSISLLKKGVIFNLAEINSKVPKYYNLFEGTVLEYNNGTYSVDNLGKKLNFKKFIIRVSDNKYLIVSDTIKLRLDASTEKVLTNSYVELTFVDEKVIRIENQEASYQTIAKDASIAFSDDLVLNLDNEYLYYKEEAKINLEQIIIDSSDNIDIAPLEEEPDDTKDTSSFDSNQGGTTGSGNANGAGNGGANGSANGGISDGNGTSGGIVQGGGSSSEEEVEEDALTLPTATVSSLTVTSNRVQANIKIVDNDSLIKGNSLTTITENSTGKIVYSVSHDEGIYNIDVVVENLNPDTTYHLNTRVTYQKNDVLYTMDVVSQLFVTESLGVHLEKDYYTSTELAFLAKIDDYSKVKSADVSLFSSTGDLIKMYTISSLYAKTEEGEQVVFSDLDANTKYTVLVNQILYDDYVIADEYSIEMSAKTLKMRPKVGDVGFTIDKKNGSFTLQLNNTEDLNNGIESYRYEVYDARTLASGAAPITTFEKDKVASVDLTVDNMKIYRSVPYVFKVVILFYDNEKYIEYTSGYSDTMQMDGVEAPSVSFQANEVTFERIDGTLTIHDSAGTVDTEKPMTIIYTNSIGITNSITTTGNEVIPFSINNLRANETYTISVYAAVNLQDGNPTVDKFHVGSVVVKTEPTNPFNTNFEVVEDLSTSFTVKARLLNDEEKDNALEASTLTGLTFTLYEGTTVSGSVVKTVKKVDRDLREYYSELKEAYYDNTFVLNPSFFGLKNSDLSADYYTVSISNAYDYTQFQNNIPIKDNTVTFKANGIVPDLPTNPDDAIDYTVIRNKDADSEHYDEALDANTIVGVKIKAIYDNAKRYAKTIHYHVYDADTNQPLSEQDVSYDVLESGEIEFVTFWFDYGSSYSTIDTDLRRGHNYYFTYDIELDLNYDGTADASYPTNPDVVLKSDVIKINKQEAKLIMYPSTSTDSTMTFQYRLSDVDQALYDNTLWAGIGETTASSDTVSSAPIVNTNIYKEVTLTDLSAGYLSVFAKQALLKNEASVLDKRYVYQYFEPVYKMPKLSYTVMLDVNRVIISLNDYSTNLASINRIAALKLTFHCGGKIKVIDFVKLTGEHAVVDINELSEFLGKSITVDVEAYYDTGITGYDTQSDYYALQTVMNEYGGGWYYSLNATENLIDSMTAVDSIYQKTMDSDTITLKNVMSNKILAIPNQPDSSGIAFNHEYLLLKKIDTISLLGDSSATFSFSQIIPGITLKDEEGVDRIYPTIGTVSFKADINSASTVIKDSLVHVKLFTTDDQGLNLQEVKTINYTLQQLNSTVEITGLLPKQNYALQFYAYIDNGKGGYDYQRLYDLDDSTNQKTYYFKTLSSINFTELKAKYNANAYDDKYLTFSYHIDRTIGYNKLRYRLYRKVYNEEISDYEFVLMDIDIPDAVTFKEEMSLKVPCNPGSEFVFDNQYLLTITPVVNVTVSGKTEEIELEQPGELNFDLAALRSPYIGISSSVSSSASSTGGALDFRVSVYDTDKVIVGGTYRIQVTDKEGNDVTPTKYAGQDFSIKAYNRLFSVDGLSIGQTYVFQVLYNYDSQNNIESAEEGIKSYTTFALNPTDIDIGDVSAKANTAVKNQIDLSFYNSNRLTDVNSIRYTIYSAADGTGQDNEMEFVPTLKRIDESTYFYMLTLPEFLPATGIYYVQMQFIANGSVVAEVTVAHTYVD